MSRTGDRRLVAFLALSLALHAVWLALPLRKTVRGDAAMPPVLSVQLAPPAAPKPAVESGHLVRGNATSNAAHPSPSAEARGVAEPAPPAPSPTIDLEAAFASARSLGREAPAARAHPPPQVTIEAAIARATQPEEVIETRGAHGEYVTRGRHSRCVTPLVVPQYLEGKTMLTQCEAIKG